MNEEFDSIIDNYVNSKENVGGLLIDGPWGCGKTYRIKEYICKNDRIINLYLTKEELEAQVNSVKEQIDYINGIEYTNDELIEKQQELEITLKELNEKIKKINDEKSKINQEVKDLKKVNKVLKEKETKKINRFVYISLNGITSLENLSYNILCNLKYNVNKVVNSKAAKIISKAVAFIPTLNIKGLEINFNDIKKTIQNYDFSGFIKNTYTYNYVLVFDDLERSTIDICELLGYLNGFIEDGNIKTIIIANEEEVSKYFISQNSDMQKIGSILSSKLIKFPEEDNHDTFEINDFKNRINTIKKEIFEKEEYYYKIKDKVIGFTYKFQFDFDYIFGKIIKDYNIRLKNIDNEFKEIFVKFNCNNMRLLKVIFNEIIQLEKRLENTISNLALLQIYKCVVISVLSIFLEKSYTSRKVRYDNYFLTYVEDGLYEENNDFKIDGIFEFVLSKNYYCERIKKSIEIFDGKNEEKLPTCIKRLNTYWYDFDNDSILTQNIRTMLEEYSKNKIRMEFYYIVLAKYYFYKELGFDDECNYSIDSLFDDIINKLKDYKNIDKRKLKTVKEIDLFMNQYPQALLDKVSKINELYKEIVLFVHSTNAKNLLLYNIETEEEKKIIDQAWVDRVFLSKIDYKEIIETLPNRTNKELNTSLRIIRKVYSMNYQDFFWGEFEYFKQLNEAIKELNSNDKLKNNLLNAIIKKIEEIYTNLGNKYLKENSDLAEKDLLDEVQNGQSKTNK